MKRRPQPQKVNQPTQDIPPIAMQSEELEQINRLKTQLKQLKQRNEHIQSQIKTVSQNNVTKRNMNNHLRHNFKKLCDEIELLKVEHLTKVQQKLKNEEGPVSDLIKDNGFGISPFALMKIPSFRYQKKLESDICMGCYEELQHNSKCKTLTGCEHVFHSQCLDQFLLVSKVCPACGVDVNV